MPDDSHQFDRKTIATSAATGTGRHPRKPSKIEWISFADLPFDQPRWLIEGLIPAKSLIMLYGARGQGKTFVALDIAASIASGLPCLGRTVANPGRVGYLLAERPEGLKRRLSGWLKHREPEANSAMLDNIFVAGSGAIKIDDATHCDRLINSIRDQLGVRESDPEETALRLLVIDPLAAHMGGSENDATDMAKFTNSLLELSKAFKCSVLVVHHEGKGNFNNRFGARGSSALEAALDTVLYMRCPDENKPNHAEISMTKQREFEESPLFWLEFKPIFGKIPNREMDDIPLGKLPLLAAPPVKADGAERKRKINDEMRAEILAFIGEHAPSQVDESGVTIDDIHAHIATWARNDPRLAGKSVRKPIIRGHVDDLKNAQEIALINPDGKPHRFRLAD